MERKKPGRPAGNKAKLAMPKSNTEVAKKVCRACGKEKKVNGDNSAFYTSNSALDSDGKTSACKMCIKKQIDYEKPETIKNQLRELNRPFLPDYWLSNIQECKNKGYSDYFGNYLKNIQMPNSKYKDMGWEDSSDKSFDYRNPDQAEFTEEITEEEIIYKWGEGYSALEYKMFERKYNMLKNNYPEKTAMHTEALLTYIRYRVKEEVATASGDSKAAKEWGTLAKDAATAAKINPSQLSKSDLSDGLDTFGQLARSVEQVVDIVSILPRFKERPQDRGDFTIWCYINYVRDLKGLPLADYSDIYKFYDERKKAYEELGDDNDII